MLLIKKTNAQELGYRDKIPNKAGKYLLISKKWIAQFPILSSTQKNDSAAVALEVADKGSVILPYVWHNDKLIDKVKNGRNEYRLYLAKALEENLFVIKPGDLVVFEGVPSALGTIHDRFKIRVVGQGTKTFEELSRFATNDRSNYWTVPGSESENIIEPVLPNQQGQPLTTIPTQLENKSDFEDQVLVDQVGLAKFLSKTPDEVLGMRLSDQMFHDVVIAAYDRKCALTDVSICVGRFTNLEAAHIHPSSHGGGNLPSNGIALSRDLHWAFDKGGFTIEKDGCVIVHPKVGASELGGLHGKRIRSPPDEFYAPRESFLDYHRTNVFGLFLRSGSLARVS